MDPVTIWMIEHPYLGAALFLVAGVIIFIFFGETSDGSRGGDASGTGRTNHVGILLSVACFIMAFCVIKGWVE